MSNRWSSYAGGGGGGSAGAVPSRAPEPLSGEAQGLGRDVQALVAAVDALKSEFGALYDRLMPLCRFAPESPGNTGCGVNAPVRSPLGQALVAEIAEINALRDRVAEMASRLEA